MRMLAPALRKRLRSVRAPAWLIVVLSVGIAAGLIVLAAWGRLDRRVAAVGLGFLLMAVPCSLLPVEAALATLGAASALDGLRIDVGISLTLPRIGLVLLALRWLALQLRNARVHLHRTPLSVPIAVWFVSLVASWVVGPNKSYGLRVLAIHFSGALLVLVVGQLARSPRAVAWLVRTLLAVGLVGVAYGLVQWVGHMSGVDWYPLERAANASGLFSMQFRTVPPQDPYFPHLSRPHFVFVDWNVYAGYLQAFWPLLFSLGVYIWTRRSQRPLLVWGFPMASAVTGVILLITFSRSGWSSSIAALIFLLAVLRDRLSAKRGSLYLAICIAAIVFVIGSGLVPAPAVAGRMMSLGPTALRILGLREVADKWSQSMASRLGEGYASEATMSSEYHFALLRLCLNAFRSRPLFGIGTGGFPFYFNEHAPEWMRRSGTWADPSDKASGMMAHSALGNSFAEGGILRGLAYLWVFYALFAALHRAIRSSPSDDGRRAVLVGLSGCAVGLFVGNILYDYTSQPFFWFTVAVAGTASQVLTGGGTERDKQPA